MKLLFRIALFFTLCLSCTTAMNAEPQLPSKQLRELDNAIKNADKWNDKKMRQLDSLRQVLRQIPAADTEGRCRANLAIASSILTMNADSALSRADRALYIANRLPEGSELITLSQIAKINALATAGIFSEALNDYRALQSASMPDSIKTEYWEAGRQLYSYVSLYTLGNDLYCLKYEQLSIACEDSLLTVLPPSSPMAQFIRAEKLVRQRKPNEASKLLSYIMEQVGNGTRLYGMCAYQMALVEQTNGNEIEYARWLAEAATADIRQSISEGLALPALAEWLYRRGNLDLAYNYINFALQDASTGNARMRTVSIAKMMPAIDAAYRENMRKNNQLLVISLIASVILLVIAAIFAIFHFRERRKTQAVNALLKVQTKRTETYIGNFLQMCGAYAAKLNDVNLLVGRKLSAGQSADLLKMVNNGRLVDERNEDFYAVFDRAFLDIYPEFVFGVNSLLRPDARFELKQGELLNPELRIYALIRLGVDSTSRIAEILRFSNNTVYTYRNRTRNRAENRDTFDEEILKIGLLQNVN